MPSVTQKDAPQRSKEFRPGSPCVQGKGATKCNYIRVIVGLLACVGYLGGISGFAPLTCFALVLFTLLAYVGFEVRCHATETGTRWLVAPPVLTSLFVFELAYGVTNIPRIIYTITNLDGFAPPEQNILDWARVDYSWLCQTEALALLGAVCMWIGYRCRVGSWLSTLLRRIFRLDLFLNGSWELCWPIVWICLMTSFGCRLAQVQLGLYGYNADFDELPDKYWYAQYLGLASQTGKLALLALALHCTGSKKATFFSWVFLIGILLYEMIFGIFAGFKGYVITPPIIILICYYSVRGRVPIAWLGVVFACIPLAYFFVEPLRIARYQDPKYDNRSLFSIASTVIESPFVYSQEKEEEGFLSKSGYLAFSRSSLTGFSALAVHFKDTDGLDEDAPPFLRDLFLAPVYAVIPRIIWSDKPIDRSGNWFSREVCGFREDFVNFTSIGPVGHLYFVGGAVAVCVGFWVLGIVQRMLYQTFWKSNGGCLLVYLVVLADVARCEHKVDPIFVTLIQLLPALVIFQFFLFKRS